MSPVEDAVRRLIACARDGKNADTLTFARLIGARIPSNDLFLLGLNAGQLTALLKRHFAGDLETGAIPAVAPQESPHRRFTDRVRGLLLLHDGTAATNAGDAHCLATIIATACERPDHLWRDLGLRGRDDVSAILQRHYPALVARNTNALRWKKFLAQEVALANGQVVTFAPGCPGCEDFARCYPEDRDRGIH